MPLECVAPTTRMLSTRPATVGAKVTLNESEACAATVVGSVMAEVVKPLPATPSAEMVTGKAQTFCTEKKVTAERHPVCTVPKFTSDGVKTRQAGFCWGRHTPLEHSWPGPQAVQVLPEKPHAVALVAVTHVVPLQQPVQLVELQVAPPVQTPPEQVWPGPHAVHVVPLRPHEMADCEPVDWHEPFEQQPAQLKKSQAVCGVHVPMVHELFIGQTPHC